MKLYEIIKQHHLNIDSERKFYGIRLQNFFIYVQQFSGNVMTNNILRRYAGIIATNHKLIAIPFAIFFIAIGIIVYAYSTDSIPMSIDFKGGTLITIPTKSEILGLDEKIEDYLGLDVKTRLVRDALGNIAEEEIFIPKALNTEETEKILEIIEEFGISRSDVMIDNVSPTFGTFFLKQAILAIIFAFVLMAVTVFLRFKTPVPSIAVVLAALSDIVVTFAVMILLGIELSKGSFIALLLLIGYSVDTDILLTTRLLVWKKEPLEERIYAAMKTGLTMSLTTMLAMITLFAVSTSKILDEIAIVIAIGLLMDIINTWIQNTGILSWYLRRGG